MAGFKLVSLNVEHAKHIDSSLRFLERVASDVVCLQELYERDFERAANALECASRMYIAMTRHATETPPQPMGVGIFSREPFKRSEILYYGGTPEHVPTMDPKDPATFNAKNLVVALCEIEKGGEVFTVGTTHFTWTSDGAVSEKQRTDLAALFAALKRESSLILTGDFNAPRGGEIWNELAARYKDNIPQHYTSSLDPKLHRAGYLQRMVDGIFSTPDYVVDDVELVEGVSDHKAIVAVVSKKS
ncbi:MAG: hypothetical protein RLZZ416_248 [Candidatus Parcubacteria bacterium]|jgi:endonuclease/exonuclease/phosphatase family metal-dependent hydrolase